MKYRDNMTPEELAKFMEEVNALDALLSSLPKEPAPDPEWEDPSDYVGMGWVGRDGRP